MNMWKAMRLAGLSLKDFRKLSKADRAFAWMMVICNLESLKQDF